MVWVECLWNDRAICIEAPATEHVQSVMQRIALFLELQCRVDALVKTVGLYDPNVKELYDLACFAYKSTPVNEARLKSSVEKVQRYPLWAEYKFELPLEKYTLWWAKKPMNLNEAIGKRAGGNERTRLKVILGLLDSQTAPLVSQSINAAAAPDAKPLGVLLDERRALEASIPERRQILYQEFTPEVLDVSHLAKLEKDPMVLRLLKSPSTRADIERIVDSDNPHESLLKALRSSSDMRKIANASLIAVGAAEISDGRVVLL